jgi:hypothetical protein
VTTEATSGEEALRQALRVNGLLQMSLFVLFSILLDGGQMLRVHYIAAVGYLAGVAFLILRRGARGRADLLFARGGFLVLLVLTFVMSESGYFYWE